MVRIVNSDFKMVYSSYDFFRLSSLKKIYKCRPKETHLQYAFPRTLYTLVYPYQVQSMFIKRLDRKNVKYIMLGVGQTTEGRTTHHDKSLLDWITTSIDRFMALKYPT